MGTDLSWRNLESRSSQVGIPQIFWWRFSLNMRRYWSSCLFQVMPRYLLLPVSPEDSQAMMWKSPFFRILSNSTWGSESSVEDSAPTPPSSTYVSSIRAWQTASCSCRGTSDKLESTVAALVQAAWCTVTERNGAVAVINPGRDGGRFSWEGWGGNTYDSQIGVFVRNSYRTEEFFYIKHSIE